MGKFSELLGGHPGYYREGAEQEFPWDRTDKGVWYALLVVEDGRIQRYGFTSAKGSKASLCGVLEKLGGDDAVLLGVWTGEYSTHLFVLDTAIAMEKLKSL